MYLLSMVLVELSTKLRRDYMREPCDNRFFFRLSCLSFEKLIVSSKAAVEILEKFFECLETRYSILDTRSSIASRNEFRVETVSLHLHGTVASVRSGRVHCILVFFSKDNLTHLVLFPSLPYHAVMRR